MVAIYSKDFKVSTSKESHALRDKLSTIGKNLIPIAKKSCPSNVWDYYITRSTDKKAQWGAICPTIVDGFEEHVPLFPNIYFDIPQDGTNVLVSLPIQFKNPRAMLVEHCRPTKINNLLSVLQTANQGSISVFEKIVFKDVKRTYQWDTSKLWDKNRLPNIKVSQCTTSYLTDVATEICKTRPSRNPDWIIEPVFAIVYEFQHHQLVQSKDVISLLGNRVSSLAPIVEHLIK